MDTVRQCKTHLLVWNAVDVFSFNRRFGWIAVITLDDKGRKFNFEGILKDWWTAEDAAEYEKRVEVMVQQANDFTVEGKPVQGKLTSGENIADLGGLLLALRAFKTTQQYKENKEIDGFTPLQRFFLAW